jgi:outer membrane protein
MRKSIGSSLLVLFFAYSRFLPAAQPGSGIDRLPQILEQQGGRWGRLTGPYRAPAAAPVDFRDSSRIENLIRGGQLYLSLEDAIALTIENNLDVELQRFTMSIANTDVLRAKGGGLPRGLTFSINEVPSGVGGPNSPLLTTLGTFTPTSSVPTSLQDLAFITESPANLSVLGAIPAATGPLPPPYDPALVGQITRSRQTTPQTSFFTNGASALITNSTIGNFGFQQGFGTGAAINVGYNSSRLEGNGLRTDYNPYTTANMGFTITQPLLQGFGLALNRRFIRIARNDERISDYIFRQQLISTVSGVIRLYWDLVSLNEDVKVKQQALAAAQKLYEDNKAQVETGTLAPIEVTRALAAVAGSRQDLIHAQSLVLEQENIVKNVITRRGSDRALLASAHIIPLTPIQVPEKESIEPVQDLVAKAFENRPDLAQARIQIENSNISLRGSKNALLPQLNLVGGLSNNALAGSANALAPPPGLAAGFTHTIDPGFLGGYGTLLSQLFSHDFPNYTVGLQLNIPLRNRVAQADVIRDELQLRQSQVRLRQVENQIRLEVENAVIAVQRARAGYDAAVQTRRLQEEALDAEQQRYSVGASTSFFVIQYQRDLAQARSTEVVALGSYAKARTALERAVGLTLENNNIEIGEAYKGRVSRPPSALPAAPDR